MKDIFGVEIEVGDWIVFPRKFGRSAVRLVNGPVTEIRGVKIMLPDTYVMYRTSVVAIVRKVKPRELA